VAKKVPPGDCCLNRRMGENYIELHLADSLPCSMQGSYGHSTRVRACDWQRKGHCPVSALSRVNATANRNFYLVDLVDLADFVNLVDLADLVDFVDLADLVDLLGFVKLSACLDHVWIQFSDTVLEQVRVRTSTEG